MNRCKLHRMRLDTWSRTQALNLEREVVDRCELHKFNPTTFSQLQVVQLMCRLHE